MHIRKITANKVVCVLLFALCLYASCNDTVNSAGGNGNNDEYNNPNAGASRDNFFSHDSGLYNQKYINLTFNAPAGSDVYYSTDGSVPSPGKVNNKTVFQYRSPIKIQNRNGQANVLATAANAEQMYMVPGDPRGWPPAVYIPTKDQVPKATVIRAITVDAAGKTSGVTTKTYFFGDNLAHYGNTRVISIVTDPFNLVDQQYGIMVRGNPNNRWDSPPAPDVYNFQKKGEAWEREAYFELFEGNANSRNIALSTGVGIRVRGGWSRGSGQKSLNVYFREEYGINNLRNYSLIPNAFKADGKTPVERYKSFMLRNGGNEGEYTKFYDVFVQDLLSDRSFTAQAAVPCVVYLNGEYWSLYNIQERYSDNHTEYKYGVDRDNVLSYDNYEPDDGDPNIVNWRFWEMMGMRDNDMSVQANYDAFCAVFDIENFCDYWAAEMYVNNLDWPGNNFRAWRTLNVEPGNPYGDTKWRWQMFDMDQIMGIYSGGSLIDDQNNNVFDRILTGDSPNNGLFRALLANANFCRLFVNTMMDLYNVNFHPDSYLPKLNDYAAVYKPLMDDYYLRWGKPWPTVYQNKVDDTKKYLNNIRNAMTRDYLPNYFGGYSGIANIGITAANLHDVTIYTSGVSGAQVKVNTVTVNNGWTGKYYADNPITVTASVPPGAYVFDGWTVTDGFAASPSALQTTVNITGNAQITANYRLK